MLRVPAGDGSEVHAREAGAGSPIVIVPGGLDDGRSWERVVEQLAQKFRVLTLHRRMYRLDLPPLPAAGSTAREANDVIQLVHEAKAPVMLVGHSSGAVIALEALAAAPELFARAVLYEPPLVTDLPLGSAGAAERARQALDAGRLAGAMAIFFREVVRVPAWMAILSSPFVARSKRLRPFIPGQIRDLEAPLALGDRRREYARIQLPLLLVGGQRSPRHLAQRLDALQAALPRAERVMLKKQGHAAHVQAPVLLAEQIASFARRV